MFGFDFLFKSCLLVCLLLFGLAVCFYICSAGINWSRRFVVGGCNVFIGLFWIFMVKFVFDSAVFRDGGTVWTCQLNLLIGLRKANLQRVS